MMVVYANDTSNNWFGALQNITLTSSANLTINLTLRSMIGDYVVLANYTDYINSTQFAVYLNDTQNESLITSNTGMLRLNISDYNEYGAISYELMVQSNNTGAFMFPLLNNSNATYEVFTMGKAPRKGSLNTSTSPQYIQMKGMEYEDKDTGENFDSVSITFYHSNSTCDVQDPDSDCIISTFSMDSEPDMSTSHPLAFTFAGLNLSMMIYESGSGVRIHLLNVDLMASGPPQAEFDDSATSTTSGSTLDKAWQIGSFAPQVFASAFVGLSYSDTSEIDESQPIRILLSSLYDDDWNEVWNITSDPTASSIPSTYSDYDITLLNASTNGALCTNSKSSVCYLNTASNIIWITIPHFSGSLPTLKGTPISTGSSGSTATKSGLSFVVGSLCPNENKLEVLVESRGSPVLNANVRVIYPDFSDVIDGTTDAEGRVILNATVSGEYRIIVSKSGYSRADSDFSFSACTEGTEDVVAEDVVEEEQEEAQPEDENLIEDNEEVVEEEQEEVVEEEQEEQSPLEPEQMVPEEQQSENEEEQSSQQPTAPEEPSAEEDATGEASGDNNLLLLLVVAVVVIGGAFVLLKGSGLVSAGKKR